MQTSITRRAPSEVAMDVIAGSVTKFIIKTLKMVHIDQCQTDQSLVTQTAADFLLQRQIELSAVAKSGDRVL